MEILQTLRDIWRKKIEAKGGHCPVCDRWGRIYGIRINRTMARALMWMRHAQADDDGWVNVPANAPRWVVRSNQLSILRRWDLVERRPNDKNSKIKHSGMWRLTPKALEFIEGRVQVPKYAYAYNDTIEGFSTETVYFRDCFKDVFDYQEAMNTYLPPHLHKGGVS